MDNQGAKPFIEIPAFRVEQPLGLFYVIKIKASDLLAISFSEPMEYKDEFGKVKGSQRPKDVKRLKEIAKYIDSVEMAFPNSLILAANYTQTGIISKDEDERWKVIEDKNCGIYKLIIPKKIKLAAVIDGQHRLNAFDYINDNERFDLELVCSIYFDLPNSYQAFLFATINSNQKRVDRSLALEQFGFNVDDEPEKAWTPEKFAVFLSRKMNIENSSPFYKHVKVAPLHPENLFKDGVGDGWVVSTATIVDGIVALISSNAKRDRIEMQQKSIFGRSRDMISKITDYSPLRKLFIEGKDVTVYDIITKYFIIVKDILWSKSSQKSYITKTVGVQASFDILKFILIKENSENPDKIDFGSYLSKVANIDFSDSFFQASGIGRSRIKNTIGIATGLISKDKIKKVDLSLYDELLATNKTTTNVQKETWEEEAERAVINTLEKAEWNYNSRSVTLYLNNDYENKNIFSDYKSFFNQLMQTATDSFELNIPADKGFAEEQRKKLDKEDLVRSNLVDYESNLKRLGWL